MSSRVVSVGEFATGAEAALAQGLLKDEGIDADIAGEMTQAWAYGMGPYTQSVRLEVREEDQARAKALIADVEGRVRARLDRETAGTAHAPTGENPATGAQDDALAPTAQEDLGPSPSDERSRRVLVAAILALPFPVPVAPVALWLLVDILVRRGPPLRPRERLRVALAGTLLALLAALTWTLWAVSD